MEIRTKLKVFNSRFFLLITMVVFIIGCQEELNDEHLNEPLEPYILSLIKPKEPCNSEYYVRMIFEDSEFFFDSTDENISMTTISSSGYGNMIGRGYTFRNKSTKQAIDIMFYAPMASPSFTFRTANYRYGNPWHSVSGANVEFFTPAEEPDTFYRYLGTNAKNVFFWITWLNEYRICGQFYAYLVECCGGDQSFRVEGEFSIPYVIF